LGDQPGAGRLRRAAGPGGVRAGPAAGLVPGRRRGRAGLRAAEAVRPVQRGLQRDRPPRGQRSAALDAGRPAGRHDAGRPAPRRGHPDLAVRPARGRYRLAGPAPPDVVTATAATRLLTLSGVAVLLVLSAAQGGTHLGGPGTPPGTTGPGPGPRPTSTGPGTGWRLVVDERQNGQTVSLAVGQRLELDLHNLYWTVQGSSAPRLLDQDG